MTAHLRFSDPNGMTSTRMLPFFKQETLRRQYKLNREAQIPADQKKDLTPFVSTFSRIHEKTDQEKLIILQKIAGKLRHLTEISSEEDSIDLSSTLLNEIGLVNSNEEVPPTVAGSSSQEHRELLLQSLSSEVKEFINKFDCLQTVTILDMIGIKTINDQDLNIIGQLCPSLQEIQLGGKDDASLHITDQGMLDLAQHCHLLQKVLLKQASITDLALIGLSLGCPRLQSVRFRIGVDDDISDAGVYGLLRCKDLKELEIEKFNQKRSGFLSMLPFSFFSQELSTLDSLIYQGSYNGSLDDENVNFVLSAATNLRRWTVTTRLVEKLHSSNAITVAGLQTLISKGAQIQELNLGPFKKVSQEALKILGSCKNMRSIDLSYTNLGDDAAVHLLQSWPLLSKINLTDTKIGDMTFRKILINKTLKQASCAKNGMSITMRQWLAEKFDLVN
jgi:hypothetical protein